MRDALDGVLNGVGKVVHGEDAPLCPLAVMLDIADAVQHGVAHIEVARAEVNLGAQSVLSLGELAVFHALEQIEALADRPVAPRADSRMGQVAAVLAELLGRQLADISQPFFDERDSVLIGLRKIIRPEIHPVAPVKAQPADVLLNGVDELDILFGGVGVVKAQVAKSVVLERCAEINDERFAVSDVQVAVGLGRKAGVNVVVNAFFQIPVDKVMNKIACGKGFCMIIFHL